MLEEHLSITAILTKEGWKMFWVALNMSFCWTERVSKAGCMHSILLEVSCLQIYDFRQAEGTQTQALLTF